MISQKYQRQSVSTLAIGANLALVVSGKAIVQVSDIRRFLPADVDAWQVTLNWLMGMISDCRYWHCQCMLGSIVMYLQMHASTIPLRLKAEESEDKNVELKRASSSWQDLHISFAWRPLLLRMVFPLILWEVTWKKQVGLQFPNENDYSTFMGRFSQTTGLVTIFMSLFVGANAIRKGWGFAAMITPVVLLHHRNWLLCIYSLA